METKIPIQIIDSLNTYIHESYPSISDKNKLKLLQRLVEFWLFICMNHSHEMLINKNRFQQQEVLKKVYSGISREILVKFKIYLEGNNLLYADLLKILQETNLIDINHIYSSGRFSKSYRPSLQLDFSKTQHISLDFKKILECFRSKEDLLLQYPENHKAIKDLYLTKIDLESYFDKIDSLLGQVYKYKKDKAVILTAELAFDLKIRGLKINLGIHFFSVSQTGRHYTSIANLPSLAVPYLSLHNQQTSEIDAANCQPLLLNLIIDHPKYKTACENGTFYTTMATQMGITREQFKLLSFGKIFFNNKLITGTLAEKLDQVYPGLVEQINIYKFKSKKAAKKAGEEHTLWFKLQSLESKIFLNVTKQQLQPVVTRHDSILCHSNILKKISQELIKEFKKYDLNVQLK